MSCETRTILAATAVLLGAGCAFGGGKDTPPDDLVAPAADRGDEDAPASQGWVLPDSVRAAGEAHVGAYTGTGAWDGGAGCATAMPAGTAALIGWIEETYSDALQITIGECRPNAEDPTRMAMSGTGRAFQVLVPTAAGEADNALGDPIANALVTRAGELGVQLIVWDRTKWNISYSGRRDVPHTGADPHVDRIYVELTPEGAEGLGATAPTDPDAPADPGTGEPSEAPTPDPTPAPAPAPEPDPPTGGACTEACEFAFDGECDDGGAGALTDFCAYGTDCFDCGPR